MRNKKSAGSKNACHGTERSHQKLAEEFLARLDCTWRRHGREILDRAMAERPELYFQALVSLTQILHRRLPSLRDLIGANIVRTYFSDCSSDPSSRFRLGDLTIIRGTRTYPAHCRRACYRTRRRGSFIGQPANSLDIPRRRLGQCSVALGEGGRILFATY